LDSIDSSGNLNLKSVSSMILTDTSNTIEMPSDYELWENDTDTCGGVNATAFGIGKPFVNSIMAANTGQNVGFCGNVTAAGDFIATTNLQAGNSTGFSAQLECVTNAGVLVPCYKNDGITFNFPAHGIAYLVDSTDGCGALANCNTLSADCASGGDCGKLVSIAHNSGDCTITFLAQYAIAGVGTSPTPLGWEVPGSINGSVASVHFINLTGSAFTNVAGHGLAAGFTCMD
jgi:hypothetical protein